MSLIFSNLVDTLYSEILNITGFSTKQILSNPYDLELCSVSQKEDGYGIIVGGGDHNLIKFSSIGTDRDFTVIITRHVIGDDGTNDMIRTQSKNLLTDCHELINYLTSNTAFTYPAGVYDISATTSGEVEYNGEGGQDRYLSTSVTFRVRIEESLD